MYWNPGGVREHVSDLRMAVQQQNIDVILLGETKLTPGIDLDIPNYHCYRRDEISPRRIPYRGTAILVKMDLIHEELPLPNFLTTRSIGIRTRHAGQELRLYAAYRPPSNQTPFCPSDLNTTLLSGEPTLLAGDLNAKHPAWNSCTTNRAGTVLHADAEDRGYAVIGPEAPTNIPTNPRIRPNVLDIVLHKDLRCPVHLEVLYDLRTQHLPILVVLGGPTGIPHQPLQRKVDWTAYRAELEDMTLMGPLSTPEDVERAALEVKRQLYEAKEVATKTRAATSHCREDLPGHLKADLRKKRELHALWARTRCPRIKRDLNRVAEKLSADVKAFRGTTWEKLIDHVGENEASLYHLNRQLTSTKEPTYPLTNRDGRRCYDDSERAETLAEHLEVQFTPHPVVTTDQDILHHHTVVEEKVQELLAQPHTPISGRDFISPLELTKAIQRLPNRKAAGPDGIPIEALKQMPRRAVVVLARLYNGVLRTQHFPADWKAGKVIMLPKPGKDRRLPASYRPITLLSHVAKLFERLLLRRIRPHIQLRDEQFGFRGAHSTTLQLTRVMHLLAEQRYQYAYTVGVFLDVEKAFDRVWHQGLLHKLDTQTSLPPGLIRIVASFLEGRHFYVAVKEAHSTPRPITAGVPQGSCLSPLLYATFTNDIPTLEGRLRDGEEDVELALFADDSAYFASSRSSKVAAAKLQRVLDLLPDWLDRWKMAVNVGKTAALVTGQQHIHTPPPLKLRGQDVAYTPSVKYLGCHIDRALRMVPMVDHVTTQAKAARALLRPVLSSRLPLRAKLRVYKTYIRSRLTYAAPAWYALLSNTQKRRIEVIQTTTLRLITGAGRFVRNDVIAADLKMKPVEEFVRMLARRMFSRADNGPHLHLRNIAPQHARPPDERFRTWGLRYLLPRDLLWSPTDAEAEDPRTPAEAENTE
ncbi:hypothetical protein O0L34_g10595 [Tuta absoluta]|nr:hypothetical protein O0L34_g10595 [Tuta absoluta]